MVPEIMYETAETQGGKNGHAFASFHREHSHFTNTYHCEADKVSRKVMGEKLSIK